MPATVSLVIRYAIMGMIMAGAFFTVKAEETTVRQTLHHEKMREISKYTSTELIEELSKMYLYNTTIQKKLHFPLIEEGYRVSLECKDGAVLVNVSANMPIESSTEPTKLKCSWVNASGEVHPGERCLTLKQKNATLINAKLEGNCGA